MTAAHHAISENRSRLLPMAATLLSAISAAILLVLGGEIAHRLSLFYNDFGGVQGMNHVADGYFGLAYLAGFGITLTALAAAWLFSRTRWKIMAFMLASAGLLASLAIFIMHRTGALVTYREFVKLYGP